MTNTPPDMKIRISATLRQKVESAAKLNNRTMNGEISARLERSFEHEEAADARSKDAARALLGSRANGPDPLEERVAALEAEVANLNARLGDP